MRLSCNPESVVAETWQIARRHIAEIRIDNTLKIFPDTMSTYSVEYRILLSSKSTIKSRSLPEYIE